MLQRALLCLGLDRLAGRPKPRETQPRAVVTNDEPVVVTDDEAIDTVLNILKLLCDYLYCNVCLVSDIKLPCMIMAIQSYVHLFMQSLYKLYGICARCTSIMFSDILSF